MTLGAGLVGALAYAAWRAWRAPTPENFREPERTLDLTWQEPRDDGACPLTHPIKGKLTSGIYHPPGCVNYERTLPDRCYVDEDAASRDGLRRAKV